MTHVHRSSCKVPVILVRFQCNLKFAGRVLKNTHIKCYENLYGGSRAFHAAGTLPFKNTSGSTVVKVLCYKSEGRWLDPNWCHWNFLLT